ncbi:MAG: SOS response-associated peptidase family protein, partial [Actinobacteria bacterium]|nr:SOS response-associated peptidase family protein [Actinomycetota bacterium]
SWARDPRMGDRLINARAETVMSSSAYGAAYRGRRWVIPADGFYEWLRRPGRPRRPVFLHATSGGPLAFAGLWETWRDPSAAPDAPRLVTCSIVRPGPTPTWRPCTTACRSCSATGGRTGSTPGRTRPRSGPCSSRLRPAP